MPTQITTPTNQTTEETPLIPKNIVTLAAFICATALILIATMGPLGLGIIQYRTSQSGIYQTIGADLTALILIVPILLIGALLNLKNKSTAKYFLILPPITLIYNGLTYGIGQEWSNPAYTGNVEKYYWLFLPLIIGGLILLIGSLSMFSKQDAPKFNPKKLRIYVVIMAIFLFLFMAMWGSELIQVTTIGDTTNGSYHNAPTAWWIIRYLDLGLTIPLGFLALYLLLTKPKRAYPLVLLFFGFFITIVTTVNAMAWVMLLNADPEFQSGGLILFSVLAVLAYCGLFYLVKDKTPWFNKK